MNPVQYCMLMFAINAAPRGSEFVSNLCSILWLLAAVIYWYTDEFTTNKKHTS